MSMASLLELKGQTVIISYWAFSLSYFDRDILCDQWAIYLIISSNMVTDSIIAVYMILLLRQKQPAGLDYPRWAYYLL